MCISLLQVRLSYIIGHFILGIVKTGKTIRRAYEAQFVTQSKCLNIEQILVGIECLVCETSWIQLVRDFNQFVQNGGSCSQHQFDLQSPFGFPTSFRIQIVILFLPVIGIKEFVQIGSKYFLFLVSSRFHLMAFYSISETKSYKIIAAVGG